MLAECGKGQEVGREGKGIVLKASFSSLINAIQAQPCTGTCYTDGDSQGSLNPISGARSSALGLTLKAEEEGEDQQDVFVHPDAEAP